MQSILVLDRMYRVGREMTGLDEGLGCRKQPTLGGGVPRGRVPVFCSFSVFIHLTIYLKLAELQTLFLVRASGALFTLDVETNPYKRLLTLELALLTMGRV